MVYVLTNLYRLSYGIYLLANNEYLHDLYSSTNIIPVTKSRTRWVGACST